MYIDFLEDQVSTCILVYVYFSLYYYLLGPYLANMYLKKTPSSFYHCISVIVYALFLRGTKWSAITYTCEHTLAI